jgi:hypothetical protein
LKLHVAVANTAQFKVAPETELWVAIASQPDDLLDTCSELRAALSGQPESAVRSTTQ